MSQEVDEENNRHLEVFVRAKTSDGRWASVNAADLDERSWRLFLLNRMAEARLFVAISVPGTLEFSTPLTKKQAEGYDD